MKTKLSFSFTKIGRRATHLLLTAISVGLVSSVAAASVPQNLGNGLGALVESNLLLKAQTKKGQAAAVGAYKGYATQQAANYASMALTDNQSRVMVRINFSQRGVFDTSLKQLKTKIPSLNVTSADKTYRGVGVLDAYVSIDDVPAMAKLPIVRSVILEIKPITQRQLAARPGQPDAGATVGEILTRIGTAFDQGVTQHRVDQINTYYNSSATQNIDGSGISIACMSDSYANRTTGTAATDVTNFDLPGSASNPVNTQPVVVLQDYTSGGTDEGRGMVQIAYKMAPKARLGFATAYFGTVGFANNIRALAGLTGYTYPGQDFAADVICDDVSYVDEPYYQDGIIGRGVNDVSAAGVAYFSSAGNNLGINGYNSDFRPVPNGSGLTSATNSALAGTNINLTNVPANLYQGGFHNFNPAAGQQDVAQTVNIPNGNTTPFTFEWDDPYDQPTTLNYDATPIYTNSGTYSTAPVTFNDLPTLTAGQEYVIKEQATSGTFDGQIGVYDSTGALVAFQDNSTDETMQFYPPATGTYTLKITQDAGTGNFSVNIYNGHDAPAGVTTDFNVLVFDMNGNYLPNSSLVQNNVASNEAVEYGIITRVAGQTQVQMVFSRSFTPTSPNPASHLRYVFYGNGAGGLGPAEYFDYNAAVTGGHDTAATCNGAAAYSVFRPSLPETFTSPGPVTIYFDDAGNRLTTPDLRLQPSVAAADAANTSFFTSDSGSDPDSNPNFAGTSAAAPHAAAIAGLVLQAHGGSRSVTPAQMTDLLHRSAFPHDLDPYTATGSARTSNGSKINITISSDSDSNAGTGGNDLNSFSVAYVGSSYLTSLVFNPNGTAATAGNVTGGNNGVVNVTPATTPPTVSYFDNSFPGLVFTPATRAFALGILTGLSASDVTQPLNATPYTGFTNLAGAPSNGTSQFYTMTLNFPTTNFTGGKILRFTVGRALQHSSTTNGSAPYTGSTSTNYIADLFGGGVSLPSGTITTAGMAFSGTTGDGGNFSGTFQNRIGNGFSPLDGFGFINAQAAVNAPAQ